MGRFSDKTAITTPADGDILPITDISDSSNDKKITMAQIKTFSATDISGKQNLITSPTNNHIVTTDGSGQSKDSGITSTSVTAQGNTFNGNSQLVQLNSSGQYPALDGSLITNTAGALKTEALGTITSGITLKDGYVSTAHVNGTLAITLPTSLASGVENVCVFDFSTASSSQPTIVTGGTLRWSNRNAEQAPAFYTTVSGARNILTFKTHDGGTNWEAEYSTFGLITSAFTRPDLTSNATMGVSDFAVRTNKTETYPLWQAFDNNGGTYCYLQGGTLNIGNIDMYASSPWLPSVFTITSVGADTMITGGNIYSSNDDSTYISQGVFTTSVDGGTNGTITVPSDGNYYKYWRINYTSMSSSYGPQLYNITFTATKVG